MTGTLLTLVVVMGFADTSSGGGWAVGSLDSVPDPEPGQTVEVGFTILQHGVTPADLLDDVGIEIVRTNGTVDFFEGTSGARPGHYVAAVQFPSTGGEYGWRLRMGWFGSQDLGTLEIPQSSPAAAGPDDSLWSAARWIMVTVTIALATIAVTDVTLTRRRAI